jgi:hypothetical protein
MARRKETPFDKIMTVRSRLGLYVEYGDVALDGKTPQEFAADVKEVFEYLMSFRNMVNGMVSFDEVPEEAVLAYLPCDPLGE